MPLIAASPMPGPLKDPAYFVRVFIEDGALTCPNGYDWDPIAPHDEARGPAAARRCRGVKHAARMELTGRAKGAPDCKLRGIRERLSGSNTDPRLRFRFIRATLVGRRSFYLASKE